jgi:NADH dehydrogenase [ubiquinone] 1 alpha subcomplex assembly factor 7
MPIKTKIDKIISSMGSISIQDFIELSNFDNEGFYNLDEKSKISKGGHFITSPEITPLFGYSLCNQFIDAYNDPSKVHLLELGPGNGTLTKDILTYLNKQKIKINQISFLEKSNYFKKNIKENLSYEVKFIDNITNLSISDDEILFIYSNEFFDAISSKQYFFRDNSFYEIRIIKKNSEYKIVYEDTILSEYLKNIYSEYNFKNGDILEHSNTLMNYLEDLKFILKNNFFFTATDYGYQKLPKKSTLRLISNHQPIKLFDKFENVDYSFGVNFELIKKVFKKFNPKIISQKDLIENFLPEEFKNTTDNATLKAKKILNSEIFFNMGSSFSNISFSK